MSRATTTTRYPHVAQSRQGHPIRTQTSLVLEKTRPFLEAGALSESDIAILDAASSRFPLADDPEVALAFAFALAAPRQGHLGVELTKLRARLRDERLNTQGSDGMTIDLVAALPSDLDAWQAKVAGHEAVQLATAHPTRPFVLQRTGGDDGILMTCRMWREQRRLADALVAMAGQRADWVPNQEHVELRLDAIYGTGPGATGNQEARRAAQSVANSRLTVITGGPGTGKTWGIKRVLALLIESAREDGRSLSIELAAPTGKAAVRMAEAMASEDAIDGVQDDTLEELKALEPRTLHKLMGKLPHRPQGFRHGYANRLGADIVVVDEASMIDVLMMRHLVEAIADGKRLVLLGDRDQLASVDAGTVLADVVSGVFDGQGDSNPALNSSIARLTRSHRFKLAASVACVAEGLQARSDELIAAAVGLMCGDLPEIPAWKTRIDADPRDDSRALRRITRLEEPGARSSSAAGGYDDGALAEYVLHALAAPYTGNHVDNLRHDPANGECLPAQPGYAALIRERLLQHNDDNLTDPVWHETLLDALDRYRVLTAHRQGQRGVAGLNAWLATAIQNTLTVPSLRNQTDANGPQTSVRPERSGEHWLGQPVMVTRNSYDVNLRNGDIGLIVPRRTSDGRRELACVFPDPRAKTATTAGIRYVSLARLPEWDMALAMTVHKSQGSQFDRIALVLPAESGSPILTRELVYTGLTRAKWRVDWVGDRSVLRDALGRGVTRASGLADLLWGGTAHAIQG